MNKYDVKVWADGQFIGETQVEAENEWKARTMSMFVIDVPSGSFVTYDIKAV